jgi:hypothetical protein
MKSSEWRKERGDEYAKVTLEVNQSHSWWKLVFCEIQAKQLGQELKLNGAINSMLIQV